MTADGVDADPDGARRLIIGVGNALCGDDGAGHAVIDHLAALELAGVELAAVRGEALELIDAWSSAESVIVVDAASSGQPVGTIRRMDATDADLPAVVERTSSHGFGLAEAVALARNVGRLPARLVVYTIEGRAFAAGEPMSPPVAAAAAAVGSELARLVRG